MIEIIGAPFDLCGMRLGSRLGPAAIRLAGLAETLESLGLKVIDGGDANAPSAHTDPGGMRNFPPLSKCVRHLRTRVSESLNHDRIPVILGGEHTLVVAGISAALEHFEGDLAVIWIDAHADINTPGSSDTGNIHGMPLAALIGMGSESTGLVAEQWDDFLKILGPTRLDPQHIVWYGLRDVDRSERARLHGLAISMHDVDRRGIGETIAEIGHYLRGTGVKNVWISFDVDALDPILAPGTGTAVRGGLSYRESHLSAELLHELFAASDCPYRLAGVDLVETNPLYDNLNQTANMAVEWIASLFGKTILGSR